MRRGRGFSYLGIDGEPVRDPELLGRIRALVIPPAWRDVWICPIANGHLQAVGTDAAGRRQYLYHQAWRTRRDQEKFDHMLVFARALPGLRQRVAAHLCEQGLTRDRVLACATRLLDRGFFRMGSEGTAKDFRTWTATVLAAVALASSFPVARSRTARTRAIRRAVDEVAQYLGNTPAVCRASYIDPRVFDRYRSGLTVAGALEQLGQVEALGEPAYQGGVEAAVVDLIEEKRAPKLDLTA